VDKIEFQKYVKAMERALQNHSRGDSVKKRKEEANVVSFDCDIFSSKQNIRSVYVRLNCISGNRMDISYHCVIDNGSEMASVAGRGLAAELTKKYRFCKAYIKQGLDHDGKEDYFFVGEYDSLLYQDDIDNFERNVMEISAFVFLILGDFIDLEEELFSKYDEEKMAGLSTGDDDSLIDINPNPFDKRRAVAKV